MLNMLTKKDRFPATCSPSNTLWGGSQEMDRMFDRLFHGFDQAIAGDGWKAPLAVWEDPKHFYVELELAGVPQELVDVTVQERQLLITYARKIPEDRQFIYNERQYGCFERQLALPDTVDVDSIKAELRDGILQITLAKAAEAQPRKIAVQAR